MYPVLIKLSALSCLVCRQRFKIGIAPKTPPLLAYIVTRQ